MKIKSKYIAIIFAVAPTIITYLTGHLTYMESTWDDFPMRFVLSGEDKIEGPTIFTGTDYMIHYFEYFMNFLYRIFGNIYWFDFLLNLPLISFFYLIYFFSAKSSEFNFKKIALLFFFFVFQLYIATNLHYSLSAIIGGFLFYLYLTNRFENKLENFLLAIISIVSFCIRFEFFCTWLYISYRYPLSSNKI